MSERNTLARSLHDVGLAAWFGGSLMGAIGLNGAAAEARDPRERLELSSAGWGRWAPVNALAIGAHAVGGIILLEGNKARLAKQPEVQANTTVKTAVTLAAMLATAYSGVLGAKVAKHADEGGAGATEPRPGASRKLKKAQRRLRLTQWAIPALTGTIVVLSAQQGEQQRPVAGVLRGLR
ncbi:hypothetical protein SAMN05216184_107125 [Georgenia satyanarayanai]|uniref:Uncharacterized protein n=1 Tax=Georgenia satyanarayanai TaxID=860221 RepID=A0A2Y9ALL3_9MICO|nr:hypothetical protein [Georgenia satyanarayanai]PYF99415.1 hypothetical protein A8987_107125 [Georgenia satyanarayanai]SSA43227.1 hypothetical protein SAMN05216184_107125 [Georgenia satyanarayanai]